MKQSKTYAIFFDIIFVTAQVDRDRLKVIVYTFVESLRVGLCDFLRRDDDKVL